MRIRLSPLSGAALLVASLALSGCMPSPGKMDEEKEPHFLKGMGLVTEMNFPGAIEAFEKTLLVNPQSASAHLQLGWLFEQKEPRDPAAAIYHYTRYLRLRPSADNAAAIQGHITACKQDIAHTVSLGPVPDRLQHELEQLTAERNRLTEENKQLRDVIAKWQAWYQASLSNRAPQNVGPAPGPGPRPATLQSGSDTSTRTNVMSATPPSGGGGGARSNTVPATTRTHVVKDRETPAAIARHYGIRLDALMAANPNLDARRMRVGQTLTIPGQ